MLEGARAWVGSQVRAVKPAFVSKKPHFNFISVHYTWIIGATIVASIAIFAASHGSINYVDALMFASGANTQAGLNPIDVNDLNLFQQIVIYVFTMTSNPITLHSSVVFLRLYWFEKRFQGWVSDARQRRTTIAKSWSRARDDVRGAEEGVNGRSITVVPNQGQPHRMTNDGILLGNQAIQSQAIDDEDDDDDVDPADSQSRTKHPPTSSDESDTATVSGARPNSPDISPLEKPQEALNEDINADIDARSQQEHQGHQLGKTNTGITFAPTVKRSDGVDDDIKFQRWSNAEHIAILERQRNQDNEILRIPGPRETELGIAPRRLPDMDDGMDDNTVAATRSRDSRPEQSTFDPKTFRERRPTIVIAEPERPIRHELTEDLRAVGGTLEALRFRKPRAFNRSQNKVHEDDESGAPVQAFRARTIDTIKSVWSRDHTINDMPYLSYTPTMARNSNFVGLTLEQREELGGIEYRSLRTLALILMGYFWGFQLVAIAFLMPFIRHNDHYGKIVENAGVSRTWWGLWTANSAFMDLGLTLTPDSMNSFNTSEYAMMIMWFFIIIGNTGFPVMLRFVIWVCSKLVPRGSGLWEELRFLLDHPRRCFTLLFPSSANWWLFWILAGLNAIDLLFFVILDLNSGPVAQLPVHTRIADGLFQAAATRTAGFSCFSMTALHPAMPVLYMIMMYISVFPIAISIRRTNVYEEKSLGVYPNKRDEDDEENAAEASAFSYVGTHLRRQLSFDLWYVFVGFFLLAISEGHKIQANEFNLFDILFEVISAYGTVGLSMGVPSVDASLCSQFTVVGKLIIIAMQIRGRHRGLPYGLDRAVLLPSESRFKKEAEEDQPILVRTRTGMSTATTSGADPLAGGSTLPRRNSISRGRERANSHIITQFFHPGPVFPTDAIHGHKRTQTPPTNYFPRANTEPVIEEKDEVPPLRTVESHNHRPRRTETSPMP